VLAGNTLLRPLVNAINRAPIDEQASEATYFVKLLVDAPAGAGLRDQVVERLEAAHYPVADVEAIERGDLQEIIATLVSTAVEARELDQVVADLRQKPRVRHATWESSTKD
jgi:putative Mg2+ transporter-C (MgtC) family protein